MEQELSWYRVQAPHFVAGLACDRRGVVVKTAPILSWARGKRMADVMQYVLRKGWEMVSMEDLHVDDR